jgi:3-phenylpropionate/cinnamic acid dioxygenase small subunit
MNTQTMLELMQVTQFIYKEARLQDEHQFEQWEALWTDDAIYWVPANADDSDPEIQMSIIYDNRSRIGVRVKQLLTGKRHSQQPQSRLRRVVSNVEIVGREDQDLIVQTNAIVYESQTRGQVIWASRNEYRLRLVDEQWRMSRKKVCLVNNDAALYTLSFLI